MKQSAFVKQSFVKPAETSIRNYALFAIKGYVKNVKVNVVNVRVKFMKNVFNIVQEIIDRK